MTHVHIRKIEKIWQLLYSLPYPMPCPLCHHRFRYLTVSIFISEGEGVVVTPSPLLLLLLQPAWGVQLAARDWTQLAVLETLRVGGWVGGNGCVRRQSQGGCVFQCQRRWLPLSAERGKRGSSFSCVLMFCCTLRDRHLEKVQCWDEEGALQVASMCWSSVGSGLASGPWFNVWQVVKKVTVRA